MRIQETSGEGLTEQERDQESRPGVVGPARALAGPRRAGRRVGAPERAEGPGVPPQARERSETRAQTYRREPAT